MSVLGEHISRLPCHHGVCGVGCCCRLCPHQHHWQGVVVWLQDLHLLGNQTWWRAVLD